MNAVRVFFIGGMISFRGLFNWLSPWIYIPSMLVAPVFQVLLFTYIGRSAGVQDDSFFLVGNAVLYSAVPFLYAMTIPGAGERYPLVPGLLLVTPARREPLFLG